MVLTWVKSKVFVKLWCSTNVLINNLQIVERVQDGKMA